MSFSNDISIVIPTHNRHFLLKRCLSYLDKAGFPFKIIVVDSSPTIFEEELSSNVVYQNMAHENVSLDSGYMRKLESVVKSITTKYILMLADDDFPVLSSIEKAYEFLQQHDDFESVQGFHFTIRSEFKYIQTSIKHLEIPNEYLNEGPIERVNELAQSYFNNFYALQRTHCWQKFFVNVTPFLGNFESFKCYTPCIGELVQAMCCVFLGKHKVIESPWLFREYIPGTGALISGDIINITQWDDFALFSECFATQLNDAYGKHQIIEAAHISEAFNIFYQSQAKVAGSDDIDVDALMQKFGCLKDLHFILESVQKYKMDVSSGLKKLLGNDYALKLVYSNDWHKHVEKKLRNFLMDADSLVIYGAGEHSCYLLEIVEDLKPELQVYITDSRFKEQSVELFHGRDCILPTRISEKATNLVISSKQYQAEIKSELTKLYGNQLEILCLY